MPHNSCLFAYITEQEEKERRNEQQRQGPHPQHMQQSYSRPQQFYPNEPSTSGYNPKGQQKQVL